MKANFLNFIIPISILVFIILGISPGMTSASNWHSYFEHSSVSSAIGNTTKEIQANGTLSDKISDLKVNVTKINKWISSHTNSAYGNSASGNSGTDNSGTGNSNNVSSYNSNSSEDISSDINSYNTNSSNIKSSIENFSDLNINDVDSNNLSSSTVNSSVVNSSISSTVDSSTNSSPVESRKSGSSSSSSRNSGKGLFYREPATNVVAQELATRSIVSGKHIRYDFTKNNTCIMYVEFDAVRTFMKTTTTVEELKNKSIFVSKSPVGRIYKYVNIWVGNNGAGLPTSIANGRIGFRVEKSWINNNNINESQITLMWYNKSWEPLYTEKVREDSNYAYFESKASGFSSFAITEFTGDIDANTSQIGAKLQNTTGSLIEVGDAFKNRSANNNTAQEARNTAKILMTISLPVFMILVGYLVVKKKI